MRDMNQMLLDNPFDEALRSLTARFGRLVRGVVTTADQHGLRQKHLSRHRGEVADFLQGLSAGPLRSDPAEALRQRLLRHKDGLFTFIEHDGVPWNNTNAEHAIKRFAYYREETVGLLGEQGLKDYLALLSVAQTCRYRGVSFFRFLRSRLRDLDRFCADQRARRRPEEVEVYPKGFVPPHLDQARRQRPPPNPPPGEGGGATRREPGAALPEGPGSPGPQA